ncbi:hypothetical protein FC47_GL001129 [Limosilactobacillus mucosae DSM 13345]|uniref:ECF transporter S component n=1 Tax=Limosilactobacillus mucosae DSM 13345 TaxID=1423771 RepID=A0A0R1NVF5_LIMMU|nr:hypothetical protein FC47_GL001129 [Limosilactobacillus mucosae DSM 13345]
MVFTALLTALTLIFGRFFLIPLPWTHGNINLCDVGIFIGAMLLGPWAGGFIGGFGAMFLDLISGFAQYAPFSFISHGLEGIAAGLVFKYVRGKWGRIAGVAAGTIVMVVGYFFSDAILYTWATGAAGIFPNLIQGIVGSVIALLIASPVEKAVHPALSSK